MRIFTLAGLAVALFFLTNGITLAQAPTGQKVQAAKAGPQINATPAITQTPAPVAPRAVPPATIATPGETAGYWGGGRHHCWWVYRNGHWYRICRWSY